MMDGTTTDIIKVVLENFPNLGIKKENYRYYEDMRECSNEYYAAALMSLSTLPSYKCAKEPD